MPVMFAGAEVSTAFVLVATIAILLQSLVLLVGLFGPGLRYKITSLQRQQLDSSEFLYVLEALTDAKINRPTSYEVLTNGEIFYEAELQAISTAERSVNLEAYIFSRGEIADRFAAALARRARAGVKVRVLLDALGSAATTKAYLKQLCDAGGKIAFYHPVRWHTLPQYNNRSHRELIVIDGRTGFLGGAGIADHWLLNKNNHPRWRDTMVRIEGDAVPNLQATFAENWLESTGELIASAEDFPPVEVNSNTAALVVNSTPSAGGSTRARVLFQLLLASSTRTIDITTPYFLPDLSLRQELVRALQRGVRVRVLTAGAHSDHLLTRSSGRRAYGDLLQAGAAIFEYEPAMIHAKILLVDGLWAVVGSTNFDNRSFGLNDEVNLAARDRQLVARLESDFVQDMAQSQVISYEQWRRRSVFERAPELLGWVFERQQ